MNRYFLITIDTEGDNLWSISDIDKPISTKNANFLFRFQEMCEKYGFVPTYLTNYEMAVTDAFINLGREGLKRGSLEIGAHEHAWNSPPYYPLLKRPGRREKPFIGEYPPHIICKKLEYLTRLLEDTFQCSVTAHRGGRWYLDAIVIKELERLGYMVDCTCTPGIDRKSSRGWSVGSRATDWRKYESKPFRFCYFDGLKRKTSQMIEIPVTIERKNGKLIWMRPNLYNRNEMLWMIDNAIQGRKQYVEFMLHSSELMPGGSPIFSSEGKEEKLYRDMEEVFSYARERGFKGRSISSFARCIRNRGTL